MNIFLKATVGCLCIGTLVLLICMTMSTISIMDMRDPSKTEIYIDKVLDVDSNRLILANGDVVFARSIRLFTWKIGQTYEITVDTYSDRFGYAKRKTVRDVKEV